VVNQQTYRQINQGWDLDAGENMALPLTFSAATRHALIGWQSQTEDTWTAFPETDQGQTVYAVRGEVLVTARVEWSGAANIFATMRIAPLTQDPRDAAAVVEPDYSIVWPAVSPPALFANQRYIYQKTVLQEAAAFDRNWFIWPINVTTKLRLQPNQALYVIMEASALSNDLEVVPFLRTLMRAS